MEDGRLHFVQGPGVLKDFKINGRIYWHQVTWEEELDITSDGVFIDGFFVHRFDPGDVWQLRSGNHFVSGIAHKAKK